MFGKDSAKKRIEPVSEWPVFKKVSRTNDAIGLLDLSVTKCLSIGVAKYLSFKHITFFFIATCKFH